jgi:hypothetical protein
MFKKMRFPVSAVMTVSVFLVLIVFMGIAQEKMQSEEYQAQAMGQGNQLGQTFNVTLHIEEYSSPEERQVLVEAFDKAGSKGLYNALNKISFCFSNTTTSTRPTLARLATPSCSEAPGRSRFPRVSELRVHWFTGIDCVGDAGPTAGV